jgi:hypothetical protein
MPAGFGATVIFDDLGRAWRPGDPALTRWLGTAGPGAFTPDDLVRNLGFVLLAEKRRALEIQFRPQTVSQRALAAALYELHDRRPDRIILATDSRGVRRDLFSSVPAFSHFLDDLFYQAGTPDPQRLLKRRVAADTLDANSPMRAMLALWQAPPPIQSGRRRPTQAPVLDFIHQHLDGRFLVAETNPTQARPVVRGLGPGFRVPNPTAFRHWVGNSLFDHPDLAYGRWVAEAFLAASTEQQPCIEDIDCLIDWPGTGQRRHRYSRMVLPYTQSDGTCALIGATVTDVSFDLRAEPLREVG